MSVSNIVTLDFNDLAAGDRASEATFYGVSISSSASGNPAMVFDTSNPTGGDEDLATSNLGNVLILSEDGDSTDPDDNVSGGTFVFDFDAPVSAISFDTLDLEADGYVKLFDASGNTIAVRPVPANGDNGQGTVDISEFEGVVRMEITLLGSGAIDNVSYTLPADFGLDGIVQGTEGDDIIDTSYEGDPHGDMIDAGDAVLPGEAADDDIVEAGAGDDIVVSGAGDDDVKGGTGDDILEGGAGDDQLLGEDGDDILEGGAGADLLSGGAGEDIILGGAGDTVDGGAGGTDSDVLDLTGQGPFRVVNETPDSNGNGTDGTIQFLDAEGEPTGDEISFTEIEDIIGDRVNSAPDAVDDEAETVEDTSVTIPVLANDTDPEDDPLTVTSASAENGTVEINADGTLTYTPNPDFNGTDTITYGITDPSGGTDTAQVLVDVSPVNDAPVAVDDADTTPFDTLVTRDVLANDSDVDGDMLTITGFSTEDGSVTENTDGTLSFTPTPGFVGEATVNYSIVDEEGLTADAVWTITVEAPAPDGIVSGTDGDDIIDIGYDGDPDGDTVDAGDAILPGEAPDDDIIEAGAGDDTVNGGAGDDEIYGGDGNDTVDGGEGNDFIDTSRVTGPILPDVDYPGLYDADTITDNDLDVVDGGAGDDTIITGDDDDVIAGGAGNDTIDAGFDDDIVTGGAGDDIILGGEGNDDVEGGEGADTIYGDDSDPLTDPAFIAGSADLRPDNNADVLNGGAGDDTIYGQDDDDTLIGGAGNDYLDGGIDNDTIDGGAGADTIIGGDGSDIVTGGDGDDIIDTSGNVDALTGISGLPDIDYPGLYPADPDPLDDRDVVDGGAGNDTITTGDDADIIDGGEGNDIINAGFDDDDVDGGAGDDIIIGSEGNDSLGGGDGNDIIYGGSDNPLADPLNSDADVDGDPRPGNNIDVISGGDGDDIIYGQDDADILDGDDGEDTIFGGVDNDTIRGGAGDDALLGEQGDDTIEGGDGNDGIIGGEGADTMSGGFGSDTFIGGNGGDVVVGGEDPDGSDIDVLDLTGSGVASIDYTEGDPEAGTVNFLDGSTMTFSEIENVIPCFTPGTMIATPRGEVRVEELRAGDKVITRDNGIQEIAWVGAKALTSRQLAANPHLKPILVKAGALGGGLPERDMMVSPNHRLLVSNDRTALYFEEQEVLASAKHLVGANGIHEMNVVGTSYIHFMCENHEVVLSNGAWTESFQPGDYSLKGIGNAQRTEILELFPELSTAQGLGDYQAARRSLKRHEAKLLLG